jgi:hypothetical protein
LNFASAPTGFKCPMTKGKHRRKKEQAKRAAERCHTEGLLVGAKMEGNRIEGSHPQAAKRESEKDSQMPTDANNFSEWIRANANVVIAVFTIVIAVIAGIQACIYNSQLTWLRIDERAWLAVKFTPFRGPLVGGIVPAPILTMNTGKTVAEDIHGWIFFRPVPIADAIDLSDYKKVEASSLPTGEPIPAWGKFGTGVIFPNDPVYLPQIAIAKTPVGKTTPVEFVWDQPSQDQWLRGDTYLALHGKFTYKDAAGNPHWTTFCNTFIAPGSGKTVSADTDKRCVEYNAVDND